LAESALPWKSPRGNTGESPTRLFSGGTPDPTRLRPAPPNGDMPNARSPTARQRGGAGDRPPRRRAGPRGIRANLRLAFSRVGLLTPLGSALLRRMGICLMRGLRPLPAARILLGRPPAAARGDTGDRSSTRGFYSGDRGARRGEVAALMSAGGAAAADTTARGAESETPMSAYPHSAQRSGVEWGRRGSPPAPRGSGTRACSPTAAGTAWGRSRRLRCQHIPIRRSEAQPSGVVATLPPAPRGSGTRVCSPTAAGTAGNTGESPTRRSCFWGLAYPTRLRFTTPNGDMLNARSPTAPRRGGSARATARSRRGVCSSRPPVAAGGGPRGEAGIIG